MTPKEKALELLNKYLCIDDDIDLFCDECGMGEEAAKLCALIAVDEIIDYLLKIVRQEYGHEHVDIGQGYWQEVKNEINNL